MGLLSYSEHDCKDSLFWNGFHLYIIIIHYKFFHIRNAMIKLISLGMGFDSILVLMPPNLRSPDSDQDG